MAGLKLRIAIIGRYDQSRLAHQAIPRAIEMASIALALDVRMEQELFGPEAPLRIHAKGPSGQIGAFVEPLMNALYEAVLFEPELEALNGRVPPLARWLTQVARWRLNYPRERRGFFLFGDEWCFFPQSPVRAVVQKKIGSIYYKGALPS